MSEKQNLIQVLERALDVMELLASEKAPMRSVDIANKLGISMQSVNNLLRTLYVRKYLSQDNSRCYRLGAQCIYLGSYANRWDKLISNIEKPLIDLVDESGFTGFVGVIENDSLLCISLLNPGDHIIQNPPQFWKDELHSTSCGRVLLASLGDHEFKKFIKRKERRKVTEATIVSEEELEKICKSVRLKSYAMVKDESKIGVSSLAIPICNKAGETVAAITIAGKDKDWKKTTIEQKLSLLKATVKKIENQF